MYFRFIKMIQSGILASILVIFGFKMVDLAARPCQMVDQVSPPSRGGGGVGGRVDSDVTKTHT